MRELRLREDVHGTRFGPRLRAVPEVQPQRIPHRMKKLTVEIEAPEDVEPGEILRAISRLGIKGRITEAGEESAADPSH